MNKNSGITVDEGAIRIHGPLTFATVPDLLKESGNVIKPASGTITIDLQDVCRADSAGLALLIEWLRVAGSHARFVSIPAQLHRLIRVSGLARAFDTD